MFDLKLIYNRAQVPFGLQQHWRVSRLDPASCSTTTGIGEQDAA
jgi:hypothetical protein